MAGQLFGGREVEVAERRLLVQESSNRYGVRPGSDRSKPALLLKGRWLNDAGFMARELVTVDVQSGKLTITLREEEGA